MRIVFLAAGAGDMYCGACARDLALVRGLLARGHDVSVIPLYTPLRIDGGAPVQTDPVFLGGINAYLQQHSALFRALPPALDRFLDNEALLRFVARFAISTSPSQLGEMTVSVLAGPRGKQAKELERLLGHLRGEGAPDVFVITNSLLSGIAEPLKQAFAKPVLCGLQGEDHFLNSLGPRHTPRAVEHLRANAAHIDLFLAPSQGYVAPMADLLACPPERIRVVLPGIRSADYSHDGARLRDPFTIGYLSVIIPGKGLDLLVKAWHRLVKVQGRNVRLRVAGRVMDDWYWEQVMGAVQRAGLRDRFEYLGEVDFSGKVALLRECSVFSVPSRIPEQRAMAVMEALAAGLPVVQPESGVHPELLERAPGGLLFPREDWRTLADRIAVIMDDPAEADRLGGAGAAGIREHHEASVACEAMERVLEEVTGRRPPRGRRRTQTSASSTT